jgi:acetylornithine deacetylase/succinyl-diaminopimelate desuccinylase-like protein
LPVNVKVVFEGEEEIGSTSLGPFLERNRGKLKCDVVLSVDALIAKRDLPSLAYGVRGILYLEVWVQGPAHDVHSGEFGGAIHNPAQVLCELIAGMHDGDGHVTLSGFYDQVRVLPAEEREELARIPYSEEELRQAAGVKQTFGEKGYSTSERLGARPTLEVNGLLSGFTGEGTKTVLPAKAMAKISMRLVPYQDPGVIEQGFMEYMRQNAPPTVNWEVKHLASADAALIDRQSFGMRAASAALRTTFDVNPVFRLEGGTLPLINLVKTKLGVEATTMGFALPDDNFHAPNERFYLPNYYRGIETYIYFFDLISRQPELKSSGKRN